MRSQSLKILLLSALIALVATGASAETHREPAPAKRSAKGQSPMPVTEWVGYHTVRAGDTVASISEKNGLSVEALKKLNPGKNLGRIKAGMRLRIKPEGEALSTPPAAAPSPAVASPAPEAAPAKPHALPETRPVAKKAEPAASAPAAESAAAADCHAIRKGDTFATVAKANGLSIEELKKLNPGKDSRRLKIGMKLVVKAPSDKAAVAAPAAKPAAAEPPAKPAEPVVAKPHPAPEARPVAKKAEPAASAPAAESAAAADCHAIRKGDTFATVAKANGLSIEELKKLNPGKDSRRLKIGMKLVVKAPSDKADVAAPAPKPAEPVVAKPHPAPEARPVAKAAEPAAAPVEAASPAPAPATHAVRKGETFAVIAKANGLTIEELKKLNPGKDSRRLKIGMPLRVKSSPEKSAAAAPAARAAEAPAAKTHAAAATTPQAPAPAAATGPAPASASSESCDVAAGPVYHKVRKGETFASIASKYGVSVKKLKKLNGIRKAKKLKPGSQLLVRRAGAPASMSADRRRELERILQNEASLTAEGASLVASQISEMAPDMLAAASDNAIGGPIVEESVSPGVTDRVIRIAKLMLDLPYRFGGTSLTGIDCSGYVQKVFGFLNLPLPRTAREQFAKGEKIEKDELATGDLVFFKTYARFPSHVGIYLGDNKFIHASSGDHKVKIDSLDTPYFLRRYIGARRLVNDPKDDEE